MADVTTDALVAARHELAVRVGERLDEITDTIYREQRTNIDAYARLDDPELDEEMRASTRSDLLSALEIVADVGEFTDDTVAKLGELGRVRARQGLPLPALIQSYPIAARVSWEVVTEEIASMDVPAEVALGLLIEMSLVAFTFIERVVGAVATAYEAWEGEGSAARERLRWELFDELLAGRPPAGGGFEERLERAGYSLGTHHAVVIILIDGLAKLERAAADAMRARLRQTIVDALPDGAMVQRRGRSIVAICPLMQRRSEERVAAEVAAALNDTALPEALSYTAAVGAVLAGREGIRASYRQAYRMIEALRRLHRERAVYSYSRSLPWLLMLEDPALAQDLWAITVGPLVQHDRERQTRLVETLAALIEERSNHSATARRLHVHRHTLTAHLERIEELTGRDLKRSDDLLLLELGLEAHRSVVEADISAKHGSPRSEPRV